MSIDDGATGITIDCVRASRSWSSRRDGPAGASMISCCVSRGIWRRATDHPAPLRGARSAPWIFRGLGRAQAQPVQARALRVVVRNGRGYVTGREEAREVGGDRGLANAALRVDHQRRVHAHGRLMLPCTRRLPGSSPTSAVRLTKAARARSIITKRMRSACEADHNAARLRGRVRRASIDLQNASRQTRVQAGGRRVRVGNAPHKRRAPGAAGGRRQRLRRGAPRQGRSNSASAST